MDKIIIEEMAIHGIIGVKERERNKTQSLLVTATLHCDFTRPGLSDDLADTIDYRQLTIVVFWIQIISLYNAAEKRN